MDEGGQAVRKIHLNPGELLVAEAPTLVSTVLGSCVSVTLFSPRLALGAICHAVLPRGAGEEPGKYVDRSVRYMLDSFRERGVVPAELVAKLFGGADMFAHLNLDGTILNVGAQNISAALGSLRAGGLALAASHTGGDFGRKLLFYTHTGEVLIKRMNRGKA